MGGSIIAIAGSSGLIGSALVSALRAADNRVIRVVRRAPANGDELHWNPESAEFDPAGLEGVDAVVNLCGVGVGDKRWSGAFKQSLRDSRIAPTEVVDGKPFRGVVHDPTSRRMGGVAGHAGLFTSAADLARWQRPHGYG